MKRVLLAVAVAGGMTLAARAQDEAAGPATEKPEASKTTEVQRPAAVEAELAGKIVSETRKNEAGEETKVYALETAEGAKIPIMARRHGLPKDLDLASFVGKNVTLKGEVVERTRGRQAGKVITRVISITAAAEL